MVTYTVQSGDTLGSIAKRFYDNPMKYKYIAEENNIENPNIIHVGQELNLPGVKEEEEEDQETVVPIPTVKKQDLLTAVQLQEVMPQAREENIEKYLQPLNELMSEYDINTPMRQAQFLAQIAHESGSFKYCVENLNYSAKALRAVFGKYFKDDSSAEQHARKPEAIANIVYANRMGNGNTDSGDGWKFRGRGLIQLTGRDNYEQCGQGINQGLVENPDHLSEHASAAVAAACWYWNSRKLNQDADQDDVKAITKKINGGYNGLEDRIEFLERAKKVLKVNT